MLLLITRQQRCIHCATGTFSAKKKPKRATLNVQLSACADLTAYGKTLTVLHTPIINSEKTTNNNLSARDVSKYELSSLVISFRMSPSYQYMESECSQHSEQKLL
jgi:hypothetical protein